MSTHLNHASQSVSITSHGVRLVDGHEIPLISGSVQYWRLERSRWRAILENVRQLGFQIIETYTPWSVHEIAPGQYDFGQVDPAKDLSAFLALCKDSGFHVLLRPGPNNIAELTWYGFPQRILFDPEIQARTRAGTVALYDFPIKPAPVPSYASEKLYTEFAVYLDALFEIVRPHLSPHGPVIGLQADNELSYFFRLAMYDLDYAPASIELYHRFLAERYGSVETLNKTYGCAYPDFDAVSAPHAFAARRSADVPYYLDWARYKEYYLLYAMHRLGAMLRERAPGCFVYHNYPGLVGQFPTIPYSSPYHIPEAEQVLDLCGVDSYPTKEMYPQLKSQVQQLAAASTLPYIPEFGSGVWPWVRPLLPDDQEFTALAALMHGAKAINFYMTVERDRWLGSPITRDNRRRPGYWDLSRHFNSFLRETSALSYKKDVQILLLANRDYERFAGVSALFTPPSRQFLVFPYPELYLNEETCGFSHAIAIEAYQWWRDYNSLLTAAGCTFDASDTELPLERLQRYRLIITPSFDFLARATQEKLLAYVEQGGRLILGPDAPYLDEAMQPYTVLADCLTKPEATPPSGKQGMLLLRQVPTLADFSQLLEDWGLTPAVRVDDAHVDVVLHRKGDSAILFVANPTGEPRRVCASGLTTRKARDLWCGGTVPLDNIDLLPYTVRVLEPLP